jgi:hypothetical protein
MGVLLLHRVSVRVVMHWNHLLKIRRLIHAVSKYPHCHNLSVKHNEVFTGTLPCGKKKIITTKGTVYDRLNIGIAGSNPAWGMDVCPRVSVLCSVSIEALRRADPPSKESYQMSLYVDREAH